MGDEFKLNPTERKAVDVLLESVDLQPLRALPNMQPCPGDHVAIPFRVGYDKDFWHHGIFMGEVEGKAEPVVIDNSSDRGLCQSLYYTDFGARERPVYIVEYEDNPEKRAIRRASAQLLARMCLEKHPDNYDLCVNNCEHLATYCSTGRWKSTQIEKVLHRILEVASLVIQQNTGLITSLAGAYIAWKFFEWMSRRDDD